MVLCCKLVSAGAGLWAVGYVFIFAVVDEGSEEEPGDGGT